MPRKHIDDYDEYDLDDLRAEARANRARDRHCTCDGAAVGPCPGPLNCPYSDCYDDNDEA